MTRPCSSACTRCSLPGLLRKAWSWAGTGLCEPEVGGCDLYLTGLVTWPAPSFFGFLYTQPAAFTAASRSEIFCLGTEPEGHAPEDEPPPPRPLSPPPASAIAAIA